MNIRNAEIKKLIKQIRIDEDNPFSTFLVIELKDRFEKRPAEEKHLDFDQWIKIYMLRDKNNEEREEKQWKEYLKKKEENKEKRRGKKIIRAKEYKNVEIPDFIKQMRTSTLLSLRFSHNCNIDDDFIYAELANRPHVPNKKEGKILRREAARRKK